MKRLIAIAAMLLACGPVFGAWQGDGDVDSIDCGSDLDGLTAFTYSCWIYPMTVTQSGYLMGECDNLGSYEKNIYITTAEAVAVIIRRDTTPMQRASNASVLTDQAWNHVVVTWNGDTVATGVLIYVNGAEVGYATTDDGSGAITQSDGNFIIADRGTDDREYLGIIEDVFVWESALSPYDVARLYYSHLLGFALQVDEANLVGGWTLNDHMGDANGAIFHDVTGNGNNGTSTNGLGVGSHLSLP